MLTTDLNLILWLLCILGCYIVGYSRFLLTKLHSFIK